VHLEQNRNIVKSPWPSMVGQFEFPLLTPCGHQADR
jgi:hypothetical protein